ncbi:F0F1 ATP synthase subunit gamma [Zavarzinia compransoris]|uniref:F0F1 ATP synthase subunit gamma n=1 Tax=Zavarzinia marina TaxID=2911065 RepID=UPI001F263602|nr:F0F1 ATP synthase subunit gamma [Zavarzinia marina]MCF4167598.1 F0F1 ATP synthase subunit gamma [Zavarzinia marina]
MSGRLADIGARIDGIAQLGMVVNAMRGIAAARAQQARGQVAAIDAHAALIAGAIGRALSLTPAGPPPAQETGRPVLILFCAEQGFAGTFNEKILDAVAGEAAGADLFLVGSRGMALATERGLRPRWTQAMPAHSPAIPKLAAHIVATLEAPIAAGTVTRLDAVFAVWRPSGGTVLERRRLLPFDFGAFPVSAAPPPLVQIPPERLLAALADDYVHAQLSAAALHAFAAENEARMEAMANARSQIERQLADLRATRRRIRQEEITAEIIELSAGETAARG